MDRLFAAVGACALAAGFAAAAESAPTPPPADIPALVRQLGAERYADREAAAAALEKVGPPAAAALAAAAARGEDPEVRERAAVLLGKVRRAADSVARLAPRKVALDYRDVPLGTALNDLKMRTGLNLTIDPDRVTDPLRKVTCRTAEVPVWEALEAFCAAAGLREAFRHEVDVPKPAGPRRGYTPPPPPPLPDAVPVVLVDGKGGRLPGDRATAVRVLVLPPSFPGHRATVGTGELGLCLDVTPVPGFGWQEVTGVKVVRVTDAAGRAGSAGIDREAAVPRNPFAWEVFAPPGMGLRVDRDGNPIPPDTQPNPRVVAVPLKVATPSARSLRRLEGVVFGEVQLTGQVLVTVDAPKDRTSGIIPGPGDLSVTVMDVAAGTEKGALGRTRVLLQYPSPYALAMRKRGWNPNWPEAPLRPGQGYKVEAFDDAGKPFPVTNNQSADMSDDGMTMIQMVTLSYKPGAGVPARLVVTGPKTVTVQVPFALDDVPLP
jgi:hypothetical protein